MKRRCGSRYCEEFFDQPSFEDEQSFIAELECPRYSESLVARDGAQCPECGRQAASCSSLPKDKKCLVCRLKKSGRWGHPEKSKKPAPKPRTDFYIPDPLRRIKEALNAPDFAFNRPRVEPPPPPRKESSPEVQKEIATQLQIRRELMVKLELLKKKLYMQRRGFYGGWNE